MVNTMPDKTLREKVLAILRCAFPELHRLPPKIMPEDPESSCFSANVFINTLATFDHNYLTRLVIACHDKCVRMNFAQSNQPHLITLIFSDRSRSGDDQSRHPTIEEAIRTTRGQ